MKALLAGRLQKKVHMPKAILALFDRSFQAQRYLSYSLIESETDFQDAGYSMIIYLAIFSIREVLKLSS